MSFKSIQNQNAPVFDQLPETSSRGFFIRRLMSLAGKPILAEKNIPIKPSSSKHSEKCYANRAYLLYRQKHSSANGVRNFKPTICHYKISPAFFSDKPDEAGKPESISPPQRNMTTSLSCLIQSRKQKFSDIVQSDNYASLFTVAGKIPAEHNFCISSSSFALLCSHKRLRSIHSCQAMAAIYQTDRTVAFKPIHDRQPQPFSYLDQQMNFTAQYTAGRHNFHAFAPIEEFYSPYPGIYGFLPVKPVYRSLQSFEHSQIIFSAEAKPSKSSFEVQSDFARNLVIECHTQLQPLAGSNLAIHSKYRAVLPVWSEALRQPAPTMREVLYIQSRPDIMNTRCEPLNRITNKRTDSLPAKPLSDNNINVRKSPFASGFVLRMLSGPVRNHMRMRLKLKRAEYSQAAIQQTLLIPTAKLPTTMIMPEKICACFQPFATILPRQLSAKVPAPDISEKHHYTLRRSAMRFLSTRHARYCINTVKNCLPVTGSNSLNQLPGQLCYQSPTTANKLPDKFTVTKLSVEPARNIYLRALSFLMKLTAMNFTDIFLPDAMRRALPGKTSFLADQKSHPLRRRNTLKSLRFKLSRIEDGFLSNALRAPRRIKAAFRPFFPGQSETSLLMPQSTNFTESSFLKTYVLGYRGRLERFAINSCAPVEITPQLPLAMPIIQRSKAEQPATSHFITPPEWQCQARPFTCKIRLAPYPFGFPGFRLPAIAFKPIEPSISFAYRLFDKISIFISSTSCPGREKSFLPPLSLKNPRRFLYPQIATKNLQNDSSLKVRNDSSISLNQPAEIDVFSHDWGLDKHSRANDNTVWHEPSLRCRNKYPGHFIFSPADTSCQNSSRPFPHPIFYMPRVKRLLLRCAAYFEPVCVQTNPTPAQIMFFRSLPRLEHLLPAMIKQTCHQQKISLHFFKPHTNKVYIEFDKPRKCSDKDFAFKYRARTYSFPWQPGYYPPDSAEIYREQDELLPGRLTFFDQFGSSICYVSFARLTISPIYKLQIRFAACLDDSAREFSCTGFKTERIDYQVSNYQSNGRLDYESPGGPLRINSSRFFKLIDNAGIKLRKCKKKRSQITAYNTECMPAEEHFTDRSGQNISSRFGFENLHWVILLHNFIDITPLTNDYHCTKATTQKTVPEFSSLQAEISDDFNEKNSLQALSGFTELTDIKQFDLPVITSGPMHIAIDIAKLRADCGGRVLMEYQPAMLSAYDDYNSQDLALSMSLIARPEYRRNLQLYILHMAMNQDDYDLYLAKTEKQLTGHPSGFKMTSPDYRHPEFPEWLDLPQILETRKDMKV